jgi:hypothetical protein
MNLLFILSIIHQKHAEEDMRNTGALAFVSKRKHRKYSLPRFGVKPVGSGSWRQEIAYLILSGRIRNG